MDALMQLATSELVVLSEEEEPPMIRIDIRSKTGEIESVIRQFAERRVGFALDHLRDLHHLTISLEDINGPKGGVDKHCRIIAEFGFTSIVLEETQPDWQSAIARAVHRLDRKITQELRRVNRSAFGTSRRTSLRTSKFRAESES